MIHLPYLPLGLKAWRCSKYPRGWSLSHSLAVGAVEVGPLPARLAGLDLPDVFLVSALAQLAPSAASETRRIRPDARSADHRTRSSPRGCRSAHARSLCSFGLAFELHQQVHRFAGMGPRSGMSPVCTKCVAPPIQSSFSSIRPVWRSKVTNCSQSPCTSPMATIRSTFSQVSSARAAGGPPGNPQ